MRRSSSRTRPLTESKTAEMAIWASGGTVFQSGSGMGGRGIIALILRAYYTKGSARERAQFEKSHSRMLIENQEQAKSRGLTRKPCEFSITIVCERLPEQP